MTTLQLTIQILELKKVLYSLQELSGVGFDAVSLIRDAIVSLRELDSNVTE